MALSLVDLATEVVFENIDRYDKNSARRAIVPTIRLKKLEEFWKMAPNHHLTCDFLENHIDKFWASLPFLINSTKYTKLDTSDLTHIYCPTGTLSSSRFRELIGCLGSNTPNLTELRIFSPPLLEHLLGERETDSIIRLKNLAILVIEDVIVPLSGFSDCLYKCKKLKSVRANWIKIDVEPSMSDTFSESFKYIKINAIKLHQMRLGMELEKDAQKTTDSARCTVVLDFEPRENTHFSLVQGFTKVTDIKCDSGFLEGKEKLHEFPHFPEVKYADFCCDGKSAHVLKCFLKRNGQTLQDLTLKKVAIKEKMSFDKVFAWCSNLEALTLINTSFSPWNQVPKPVEVMQRLKSFEWINSHSNSDAISFSIILRAPLLEKLFIQANNFDLHDNNDVIRLINNRKILQNLKTFLLLRLREERETMTVTSLIELQKAISSVIRPN